MLTMTLIDMIGNEFHTRVNTPLIVRNDPRDSELMRKWWAFKEACLECPDKGKLIYQTNIVFRGGGVSKSSSGNEAQVLVAKYEDVDHTGRGGPVYSDYLGNFK